MMAPLHIDADGRLVMTAETLIGESVAVLGIKGSGKTNTAAVLIEELLQAAVPLAIVDIEGEYWGLKERFDILVVGKSPNVDAAISPDAAGALARFAVENNLSLVLDVSEFLEEARDAFLLAFFTALWDAELGARKPYQIVLEEAHEFVPQSVRTPLKTVLTRIALRGRKRGLGIISVSQRSAKVEKDVLTQAAVAFLHRVVHPVDLKVYEDIIPRGRKEVESLVAGLGLGDAIVLHNHDVQAAHIRQRHTYHAGATPSLDAEAAPRLRSIDSALLDELRKLSAATPAKDDDVDLTCQLADARARIQDLETLLEQANQRIDELSKLEVVGNVSVVASPVVASPARPAVKPAAANGDRSVRADRREHERSERAVKRERERFGVLLRDATALPALDREIIIFLLEREERAYSKVQLARSLGVTHTTLTKNPPTRGMNLGLVRRRGRRGDFVYQSCGLDWLAQTFPNLDADDLRDQLIKRLKVTLR